MHDTVVSFFHQAQQNRGCQRNLNIHFLHKIGTALRDDNNRKNQSAISPSPLYFLLSCNQMFFLLTDIQMYDNVCYFTV